MKPILKWVGGKRQIMSEINKRLPKEYGNYFEPFLGGASVLMNINPEKAYVNDLNNELINVYEVIKQSPKELIENLKKHKNESDYFYKVRSLDRDKEKFQNMTNIQKASRIIYLNKTCYNGLYRVNLRGELNAPFGRYKNPLICDEENIKEVSHFFNEKDIRFFNEDFEQFLSKCKKNDFVYLDPPYDPINDSSNFTGYNANGFGRNDQKRLKKLCDKLDKKGVKFLLSNSSTKFINDLYKEYKIDKIDAKRSINSKGNKRGSIKEVLVRNYE